MLRNKYLIIIVVLLMILALTGCRSEVENENLSVEYNGKTYEGQYTGVLIDGIPAETGKFVSGDPDTSDFLAYEGNWENGVFKDEGTLATDNYSFSSTSDKLGVYFQGKGTYAGAVIDGVPNGKGAFQYGKEGSDDYLYYEGDWEAGTFKGEGKLSTSYYATNGAPVDNENKMDLYGTYEGDTLNGLCSFGKYKIPRRTFKTSFSCYKY